MRRDLKMNLFKGIMLKTEEAFNKDEKESDIEDEVEKLIKR